MIIVFDTETTGLVANHSVPLTRQPEIIEFYGALIDPLSGEIADECHHVIRPGRLPLDPAITKITSFTDDMFDGCPRFVECIDSIAGFLGRSDTIVAHNLSFDMEMVDIEFSRLNRFPAWPQNKICSVEQTAHLAGYRLGLTALHEYLFGENFPEAHRAKPDTQALIRCVVELYRREEL